MYVTNPEKNYRKYNCEKNFFIGSQTYAILRNFTFSTKNSKNFQKLNKIVFFFHFPNSYKIILIMYNMQESSFFSLMVYWKVFLNLLEDLGT